MSPFSKRYTFESSQRRDNMTVITLVLSNSTSAAGGTAGGFVQDFPVVLPKSLVVRGRKCRLLESTCIQQSDATGQKLLTVSIPFLSKNSITGSSSNAAATDASASNIAFDRDDRVHGADILLSCTNRMTHTVFPPGHDYGLSQTTIPKHFVVKVRSGTDGSAAVEIKYIVLKFAMDVASV